MKTKTKPCPFEDWRHWLQIADAMVYMRRQPDHCLARAMLTRAVEAGKICQPAATYLALALEVNPKARLALVRAFDVALEHRRKHESA